MGSLDWAATTDDRPKMTRTVRAVAANQAEWKMRRETRPEKTENSEGELRLSADVLNRIVWVLPYFLAHAQG